MWAGFQKVSRRWGRLSSGCAVLVPCKVNTARLSSHTGFFSTCVLVRMGTFEGRALRMQVGGLHQLFPPLPTLQGCALHVLHWLHLSLFKWHWRDHRVSVISSTYVAVEDRNWKKLFLDAVNCLQSCSRNDQSQAEDTWVMLQLVCSR